MISRFDASAIRNPRLLLALVAIVGYLSTQPGRGTLAYFTSFDFATPTTGYTKLYNNAPIGVSTGSSGVGVTGTLGSAPSGLSDNLSGGKGADLWGGTAGDNAPDTTKSLAAAGAQYFC